MINTLQQTFLTICIYAFCFKLYQKTKWTLLNPLLVSIVLLVGLCLWPVVDYTSYKKGTWILSYFLGPATVVLAVPMYRQLDAFKKYALPIVMGTLISVPTSLASVLILAKVTGLPTELMLSLTPKSITTPIGLSLSQAVGGIPAITVVSIVMTGILGAIISPLVIQLTHIKHPVAQGIGIGSSSHVLGTTKAMEMGETIGAMSSLSIALTGILTYILLPPLIKIFL